MTSATPPTQTPRPVHRAEPASPEPAGSSDQILLAAARRRRRSRAVFIQLSRLALLVGAVLIWQLISGTLVPTLFISRPDLVVERLGDWASQGLIVDNTLVTLNETLLGFVIGTVAGGVVGIALGRAPLLGAILNPMIVALYGLPKLALAPLLILWFGIGASMKVSLSAIIVFFLVFYNTYQGARSVPEPLLNVIRVMGGGRVQLLRRVILPSAAVWVFTGLRISVPYALSGAIVGEIVASNSGLGYLVQRASSELDTAGVFAGLVIIGTIALVLHLAVDYLQRISSVGRPGGNDDVPM